ncbi:hypothetical protein D3C80_1113480 [compost metagenome]
MFASRDPDGARGFVTHLAERRQFRLDFLEPRACCLEETFTCRRGRYPACRAGQQPKPETLLETSDGLAKGGLRDTELHGCPRKTLLTRDRDECDQIVEILLRHSLGILIASSRLLPLIDMVGKSYLLVSTMQLCRGGRRKPSKSSGLQCHTETPPPHHHTRPRSWLSS